MDLSREIISVETELFLLNLTEVCILIFNLMLFDCGFWQPCISINYQVNLFSCLHKYGNCQRAFVNTGRQTFVLGSVIVVQLTVNFNRLLPAELSLSSDIVLFVFALLGFKLPYLAYWECRPVFGIRLELVSMAVVKYGTIALWRQIPPVQLAFLVNIATCSGTIFHVRWCSQHYYY